MTTDTGRKGMLGQSGGKGLIMYFAGGGGGVREGAGQSLNGGGGGCQSCERSNNSLAQDEQ